MAQDPNIGAFVTMQYPADWVTQINDATYQFASAESELLADITQLPVVTEGEQLVLLIFFCLGGYARQHDP
ncbi:MAG: hypothetical protein HC915_11920 [Anaerolineae bacterium]|nr:hypothetical protein [Anaerolineae bacterium]